MQYDVFISHASVDKEAVARPLSEALQACGLSVWLDEEQLQVGDSIRRGIDQALTQSLFGVVILSSAYLESEWTRKELDALFTKEKHQNKTILPVSYQLERADIEAFSPMLADKITLSVDEGIEVLADQIKGSVQALPKVQQATTLKGWGLKFPTPNWQWLIATVVALAAIAIPVWMSQTPSTGMNFQGAVSGGNFTNVQGDQTIIHQGPTAEELANQLAAKMGVATTQDLRAKDDEIKRLTETVTRLQQQPGDEYKQDALKKLEEDNRQEAATLLKLSLNERQQARDEESKQRLEKDKQMSEDWVDVGNIAYLNNAQEALKAYQQAVELDPDNIEAWNQLGHIQRDQGNLDEARQSYETVLELAGNDESWQAIAYGGFGLIYLDRDELGKAEEFLLKSLKINETIGRKKGIAVQYGNLGLIYRQLDKPDKAEEFHLKALAIDETLGRKEGIANHYANLGLIYLDRNELGKAEESLLNSLKINEVLGREKNMANRYSNLGVLYRKLDEPDKAEEFFLKALAIDEALGRTKSIANQYIKLGLVYQDHKRLDKAEEFHLKALSNYEALGLQMGMAATYASLGLIKQQQDDLKTACKFIKTSVSLDKKIGKGRFTKSGLGWIDENCPK